MGLGEVSKLIFFARNCIKCPDLFRKITLIMPGPWGEGSIFQNVFLLGFESNVQICTEMSSFSKLHPMRWGWGEVAKYIVG